MGLRIVVFERIRCSEGLMGFWVGRDTKSTTRHSGGLFQFYFPLAHCIYQLHRVFHSRLYILNTPYLLLSFCPITLSSEPIAAFNPSPNTLLVCAGGIIPSSQSRADEKTASLSRSIRSFSSGSTVLPTASMTDESCCEPMTPILALGHIQRKRGE